MSLFAVDSVIGFFVNDILEQRFYVVGKVVELIASGNDRRVFGVLVPARNLKMQLFIIYRRGALILESVAVDKPYEVVARLVDFVLNGDFD